jgi:hypothetical protein
LIGWRADIHLVPAWYIPVAVYVVACLLAAIWAWRDAMGMLSFQAKRPWKNQPKFD